MAGDQFILQEPTPPPLEDKADWALQQAVRALHSLDERAPAEYRMAVSVLSDDPSGALAAAERALEHAETDPMLRWSVVNVIGGMRSDDTVSFLHRQSVRDLGEFQPEGGCEQPVDVEILVAVMAVEGLQGLAENGNKDAIDALVDVITRQPERAVRDAAVRAAIAARPKLAEKLAEVLGNDRGLLDTRAATAVDLTADPDLDDPEGRRERHITEPKPADRERALQRQRPLADPCGHE